MAAERARVLRVEDADRVRFDGEARAVVIDASVVPLAPETIQSVREQAKVPLLVVISGHEEAWLALQLGCDEVLVRPYFFHTNGYADDWFKTGDQDGPLGSCWF